MICAAVWLSVRLSLVGAVFVLERSFALRKGWQATKGRFWTLLLTFLIISIAYLILQGIVIAIMYPGYFSSAFSTDPAQAVARQQQMVATLTSPSIGTIISAIIGTVLGTAGMVFYVGVISTAAISAIGYSRQDLAELESHFE
jgi:membrane-anchored glycerophosphoryl diester phosphodiesterase (GDPDase)